MHYLYGMKYLLIILILATSCTKVPTGCDGSNYTLTISNESDLSYFVYLEGLTMGKLDPGMSFRFDLLQGVRNLEIVEAEYDIIPDRRYKDVNAVKCGSSTWVILSQLF
jgi:hypothetical protein